MAEDGTPKAPYVAFATFDNFISERAERPEMLPPRIDPTVMTGMSGGTQSQLKIALRFFGLVDEDAGDATDPSLGELVKLDNDGRRERYGVLLQERYPEALELSAATGTAGQLSELFTRLYGHTGSTRDKAIRFFLQMAEHAGVAVSPYFAVPRATPTAKKRKAAAVAAQAQPPAPVSPAPVTPASRNSRTVALGSGGAVTLSYDVDLFDLSDGDRDFVLDLVDKLRKYEAARQLLPGPQVEEPSIAVDGAQGAPDDEAADDA